MKHEPTIGLSDEWYTPPSTFDAFGCRFQLDPCSPGAHHWVPADEVYTKADNGLSKDWRGRFVYMNPPFGGRNGGVPWIRKYLENSNGIACVRAYTSCGWFHDLAIKADCLLFPKGKTKFVRPDGDQTGNPGGGVVFLGVGTRAFDVLRDSSLGWFVDNRKLGVSQCS